jgi:dolichol-phosphate mannosyltransferase
VVVVVLPAYNEAPNLGLLLPALDQAMRTEALAYEVVVVDDGSTDGTAAVAGDHARSLPIHLERHAVNQGLGATVRDGLRKAVTLAAADGDIVVVMDADNTHPPALVAPMVEAVRGGADVVIASRYRAGARVLGVPWHRRMLSLGARALFQVVFPTRGVRDYTCGYRAYRARVLREAFRRYGDGFVDQGGFQCMADILLKLRALDLEFREVPLTLRYDLKQGTSKMRVARTIGRSLALIGRHRFGRRA